jgi:hypothetical protein
MLVVRKEFQTRRSVSINSKYARFIFNQSLSIVNANVFSFLSIVFFVAVLITLTLVILPYLTVKL